MKNVLYYDVHEADFETTPFSFQSVTPAFQVMVGVARYFRSTIEALDLTLTESGAFRYRVEDAIRVQNGRLFKLRRIELTFKDEDTALLFKLTHQEGGEA